MADEETPKDEAMARLQIFLFGTVQVIRDERPVSDHAYAKVLGLLAYLAVESGRPHQRAFLAALLWPDQSDERARHSLRQALSTLRRMVDDRSETPYVLTITRDAITLHPESDVWIDVRELTQLVQACERHEHARIERCVPCMQRLERVVALYRGDFLQGFSVQDSIEFEDWVQGWREQFRQEVARAHTAIAAYRMERGDLNEAASSVRQLLTLDPLEESAQRRLIQLLVQSGKRGEALAQYERFRVLLDEELGVEPELETQALYEHLRDPDTRAATVPIRWRAPVRGYRLPVPVTTLIGRERELEEIADLLAHRDCRLITLTGPGGSGKTRLAIEVAIEQERQFPGHVCFVPLAAVRDPTDIVAVIARELGVTVVGGADPEQQLLDWLRDRSLLLIIDNADHLVDHLQIIARMLSASQGLTILATSRERLNLHDEWVFEVGGLIAPTGDGTDGFEGYGCVELLRERLRQVRARTPLHHEERPAVVRICRLVEGMPLAIELAATWAQSLSLEQIAEEIQKNLDFLTTSLRDVPDRHRSIRAVFNQSWSMLSSEEQVTYRRLSVFRDGFSLDAAESIVPTSALQLVTLTSKSLLTQHPPGRYHLHELLRQYGDEQLRQDMEEFRALHRRHCEYYLELLAGCEDALTGPNQQGALNDIERDIENIVAAWRCAVEEGRMPLLSAASHPLWLYYVIRGRMRDAAGAFGHMLAALEGYGEPNGERSRDWTVARAKALTRSGGFQSGLGRYDDGITLLEEGITLLRQLDDCFELGLALNMLAAVYHLKGEFATSRTLLEESLEHFRHVNDAWGIAFSLNDLGLVSYLLEENVDAEQFCEESRAMFRELGDRRGQAFAAFNLGMIAAQRGDYERARNLYEESLSLREISLDRCGIAASLVQLGTVLRSMGSAEEAHDLVLKALQTAWDSSIAPVVLDALVELAALQIDAGEAERAMETIAAIAAHPATPSHVQQRVSILMQSAEMPLPGSDITGDRERWAARVIDDVARSLVG